MPASQPRTRAGRAYPSTSVGAIGEYHALCSPFAQNDFDSQSLRSTRRSGSATLASAECQEFEIGALMNLCPDTPEEARSLVQSLENVGGREQLDDDRLQQLLDELRTYRSAMR